MIRTLLALSLITATPLAAQTAPEAESQATIDPARVAAGKALLNVIMPPETREAMMDQMMTGLMANIQQGFAGKLGALGDLKDKPEVEAIFDRYMARQQRNTIDMLKENLPGMFDAMANAYARRFTVAQMEETQRFFATPTGQIYMKESVMIMSDPDIAAWQRQLMTKAMEKAPAEIEIMTKELKAAMEKAK